MDDSRKEQSFIKGYPIGANVSLVNVIYLRSQKNELGKWGDDYLYIVFKDMDTQEVKMQELINPKYTYYISNGTKSINHNLLYIEKEYVEPVTTTYRDLKKSIAEKTNNLDWYYDCLKSGNFKDTDRLFEIPTVFNADMHIEDYYRKLFARLYKNEPYNPTKVFFDIEVNVQNMDPGDSFPEHGKYPIDAITVMDDAHKKVYTLLLEDPTNPLVNKFKHTSGIIDKFKAFIQNHVGGWKEEARLGLNDLDLKIIFFKSEIDLIVTLFKIINTIKANVATAWNIAFDLPYIIDRIKVLGFDPRSIICHPDFEHKICEYYIDQRNEKFEQRNDYALISSYTVYVDQLITFASRRKGQRQIQRYNLDYVGTAIAGFGKLDYSGIYSNLTKLPAIDYETYVLYNIIDVITQAGIEHRTTDLDYLFLKSLMTNTRFQKVHRQTTFLVNKGIDDFYADGFVMGNNPNKHTPKTPFVGAVVLDPLNVSDKPKTKINGKPIDLCPNAIDYDYSAMYPSIVEENNMSPATMWGKILFPEALDPNENRFNHPNFNRSVWFMEDLHSLNWLEFCVRYFGMPDYEKMYDLIGFFFKTVTLPSHGLRNFDLMTRKRVLYHVVGNSKPRNLYKLVDNSQKRQLYRVIDKMPNMEVGEK